MTADKDAPEIEVTDGEEPTSTATEAETIEADAIETPAPPKPKSAAFRRVRQGAGRHWAGIALTVVLVAAAGLASWMFFFVYKPNQATNDVAMQSAEKAAADGTVALLSYSPDSLDKDFATAQSKLTGSFLSYYKQFTEQIVKPAAKQKAVKTQAAVVRRAVAEIHPDRAVVLVFINQTTESKDRPDASFINSAVRVTLQKIDGGWLISSFDPV